ncbi:MAG: hypothetical protein CMH52_07295 [Myxococcales bacterium]|nr:hypothetical protein [Myxococcales bacterium]
MRDTSFHGFDVIPRGRVVSGLGVYRFERTLTPLQHLSFLSKLESAQMTSSNGRLSRDSIPALPAMGLKQLFALGHCAPRTADDVKLQRETLSELHHEFGLIEAWAFLVDTCVDVSTRQTTGEIRWRNGAPCPQEITFQCDGDLPSQSGRHLERFAVNFKLATRVCPESAGVLVAFCQHWLAPYTDHVAKQQGQYCERAEAQCYMLGDVNIGDDGQTVRFRMDHLILPGAPKDCLHHTLSVIEQINDVLPVEKAWLACA